MFHLTSPLLRSFWFTLLGLIGLVACQPGQKTPPTATPFLTPTPAASPTPVPDGAAEVGQTFYTAWENQDLLGMYSLLSTQSQALVGSGIFTQRYQQAMQTATVQTVEAKPLALTQEQDKATLEVEVIWHTAVLGDISRRHKVNLVYSNDRWGVVWNEGLILPELLGGNQLVMDYRIPSRANIYDVNGRALAFQGTAIMLSVVPGRIQNEAGLLATLSPILGKTPEALKEKYASADQDWLVPLGQISAETMQTQYAVLEPFIGAGLVAQERLSRLYNGTAPHLVGYIGAIPAGQQAQYLSLGYKENTLVGLTGLEAWGESYLSGVRGGILTVVDPSGRYVTTVAEAEPKQARSIYTTFNLEFQQAVETALAEAVNSHPAAEAGAVVVMNVQTGQLLAMASYPTYDPNVFDQTQPNSADLISALFNDARRPLYNRAAQGEYPPGSVFKIVTMAAAIESGLYTANTAYNSTGSWDRLGPAAVKFDWREGGHGYVSLRTALVVSCNSCFYDAAFTMDGADPFFFPKIARQMGFGSVTGISEIVESPGLIPDPDWKIANSSEGGWVTGDAVNMGIGQGFVKVTPLQVARLVAAVANGGTLPTPSLISKIGSGAGVGEEAITYPAGQPMPINPEILAAIRDSMRQVVAGENGTASFVFEEFAVPVAGKTGTAQTPQILPHAWFASYAPAEPYTLPDGTVLDRPEIAVVVIMENAGEGSEVAAPVARRIYELYYGITPQKPFPW